MEGIGDSPAAFIVLLWALWSSGATSTFLLLRYAKPASSVWPGFAERPRDMRELGKKGIKAGESDHQ